MVRCTLATAAVLLKVFASGEGHDKWDVRWPHINALSALDARLVAAEREANATQAAMASCAAELRAERDALAKTRATVSASEQDVLKGKDALQQAEARRTQLRGMVKQSSEDVPAPNALQSEELEAFAIFTSRVQQEAQELTQAKAKLAEQIEALKVHDRNKGKEVKAVKAELERIESRTQVWEEDKHVLSEALAANNRSILQHLPNQKELDELRDLEQVVIPSVSSSIDTQEEIVASVMAMLNSTRLRLRACLESSKSSKQSASSPPAQHDAIKQKAPHSAKQQTSQSTEDSETSADQAAATELGNLLKDSSLEKDANHEEDDIETELHAELSADEPYQPKVTAKSMRQDKNASQTGSSLSSSTAKSYEKPRNKTVKAPELQDKKVEEPKSQNKKTEVPQMPNKLVTLPLNGTSPGTSATATKMVKAHNTTSASTAIESMKALKVTLAAPRKMAESLHGQLDHRSSQKHSQPKLPTFGEQIAGILR
jgi:hypothetical protein